jgi:hypothetical protein
LCLEIPVVCRIGISGQRERRVRLLQASFIDALPFRLRGDASQFDYAGKNEICVLSHHSPKLDARAAKLENL